jgi:hypothetical protein
MSNARAHLPLIIAEIAEIAGIDAAWAIARAKGGTTAFIPKRPLQGHWLVELVGMDAARHICDRFGSERILIPMAASAQKSARWTEVIESDMSIAETAKAMDAHQRTVSRRRAELRAKSSRDRQTKLF